MVFRRLLSFVAVVWLVTLGWTATPVAEPAGEQAAQSIASSPERLRQMHHHFGQVALIHEALIRGALEAVQVAATELATMPTPPDLPQTALPYVEVLRLSGRLAADATTLDVAAEAAATMLTQCGLCHRSLGVPVALVTPEPPDVGGVVGHMLEHQQAIDAMLQGLFVPSASQWTYGAERLRIAPLESSRLPPDDALRGPIREAETRVHEIAHRAEQDADNAARARSYVELVTTCAECHGLHSRVWGPDRRTTGAGPNPVDR